MKPNNATRATAPVELPDAARVAEAKRLIRTSLVTRVLDVIGDRWTILILRALHAGEQRFDWLQSLLRISRSTLASRLADLEHYGLIARDAYQTRPVRFAYRLTGRGQDTFSILHTIHRWDQTWGPDTSIPAGGRARRTVKAEASGRAEEFTHTACGHVFQPILCCAHCHAPITARDMRYRDGPGIALKPNVPAVPRRARRKTTPDESTSLTVLTAADLLVDRWTALIISCAFFGLRRFSDMQAALDIAPNILSRRLVQLTGSGIFARHIYQERPRRWQYIMTEKGFDIFPITVGLLAWGDRWLAQDGKPPLALQHRSCGKPLRLELTCGHCRRPTTPDTLRPAATLAIVR
ncbi:MAG: winged helix-turn-helix transcriptional regulator [Alphaproteobacteria bacterium]